jgi:hypothetical protein
MVLSFQKVKVKYQKDLIKVFLRIISILNFQSATTSLDGGDETVICERRDSCSFFEKPVLKRCIYVKNSFGSRDHQTIQDKRG